MSKLVPNKDFIRGCTSMTFLREVSYDEWEKEGKFMLEMAKAANGPLRFWWGDWLIYGEDKFGEKFSQAVDASGYELGTLRNAKWVCNKIAPERRRDKLSFGHHQVVASLPLEDQEKWLTEAELESWSVAELRNHIKGVQETSVGDGVTHIRYDSFDEFLNKYHGSAIFDTVKDQIVDDLKALYEYAKQSD